MFDDLTKAEKRALREAARLACDRDASMPGEDRDVHYLQARNANLPLVVAGAVVHEIISIDDVGAVARELIRSLTARLAAAIESSENSDRSPIEEPDPYDPNAVVSVTAILEEIDFLTSSDEASLFVNTRAGEARVSLGQGLDEFDDDAGFEEDEEWLWLLNRYDLDEIGMMKRFARDASPAASQELYDALGGRGAFRRFREVIQRRGLQQPWAEYREGRIADQIRFALEQRKVPFRK